MSDARKSGGKARLARRCGLAAVLAIILGIGLPLGPGAAAQTAKLSERTKQKRAAESERAELQQKLDSLKRDIQKTESARHQIADELAQSERAISEANRAMHELLEEQKQTQARVEQLSEQQNKLMRAVAAQQQQLAKLLRDQYQAGGEDRVKSLLSGDNPNRISRELRYLSYVSKAQAALIESLRANLRQVEANKAETQAAKEELDEIAAEAQAQKQVLEQEQAKRAGLLTQLSSKLAAQRKEAGGIQRNEQRLGSLVDKLSKLIEQQQKEEEAALKRRQQAAAKEAQRKARAAEQAAKAAAKSATQSTAKPAVKPAVKPANPDAIDDDAPPPKSAERNELTPEPSVQASGNFPPFSSLRGRLRLPVRGELAARFGGKREDGPSWKGLFIRAAEGAEVKAVAAGRVVFADWLRGFGNLIILDHGNQYLTIYGYNQAVLKRAGDTVKTGDVIASAGNSGGNEQSGLYFEMRHQGRAFDPLEWVVR